MYKIHLFSLLFLLVLGCKKEKSSPPEGFGDCNDITANTAFPVNIPGWKIDFFETSQADYWDWKPCFINETIGFIYENNGHVWKTLDGGNTWKQVLQGAGVALHSMFFVDIQNGFLSAQNLSGCPDNCGHNMTIFRTTDGGETWGKVVYDQSGIIWDLYFSDPLNGIGYANLPAENYSTRIVKTVDGGHSWELLPALALNSQISFQFQMLDKDNGFFAGRKGELYRTRDGCVSFDSIQTPLEGLRRVEFLDKLTGFAADYYKTYRTSDGGNTWELVCERGSSLLHLVNQQEVLAIQKVKSCIDYDVIMFDSGFFTSTNGGLAWDQSERAQNFEIYNYHFPFPNLGFGMYGSKLVKFTKQ